MSDSKFEPVIAKLDHAVNAINEENISNAEKLTDYVNKSFLAHVVRELNALKVLVLNNVPLRAQLERSGMIRAMVDAAFPRGSKVGRFIWEAIRACEDSYR